MELTEERVKANGEAQHENAGTVIVTVIAVKKTLVQKVLCAF